MTPVKSFLISLLSGITFLINAQLKPDKLFYKDTAFNFNGFHIEAVRNASDDMSFKSTIVFTNPTNKYMLIDPDDIFGIAGKDKYLNINKRKIVIKPNSTKRVRVKFMKRDFRDSSLSIYFEKMLITDDGASIYQLKDLNITLENYREVGPVKWTLIHKSFDFNDGIIIKAKIEYSGNQLLIISSEKMSLKTKDGGNYINNYKKSSNFYYDKTKIFEPQILGFPAKRLTVKEGGDAILSFNTVFTEYPILKIEGFKINLRIGTLEDYKGREKVESENDDNTE